MKTIASSAAPDRLYHPALWPLDPKRAHVNHGSFGAVPLPVLAEQQRWRERMEANPTGFFRRELQPALEEARRAACAFLGSDAEDLTFVQNSTAGAGAVLAGFPLAAGDEILVTDHVYGAVLLGARKAAARAGASVVTVPVALGASDEAMVAALASGVTPRTRLAVVDHVASATAQVFPVRRIVASLHALGVAVLVDGAHAPGLLPVDLGALGADFWVGNFHKWPCAPRGSAGLYVAERWRDAVGSFPVSWREQEGFPYSFLQPGTVDSSAWLAVPAALELFGAWGWDEVRERNGALAAHGQRLVAQAVGGDVSGMPGVGEGVGAAGLAMRLVPLPQVPADQAVADSLRDRMADEFGVETVINVWGGYTLLRVSAQLYNDQSDYERLADAVRAVV
ncbi:aminotransferase class V-fold PLP-dependent enzyme [Actinocrinis puniceicyclus]|uniref:Aminotransferase class V-fold PLP-dependent enzyme n=1 Tax=Actinocrinis puniceicyclus TaxID=977794 RepID=A0A8J7WKZ3_9ACTN|nr:aminotransferase class V-fold PLP-dependent enzyme [Actinocrinis puniceicyclus]MBS2964261.1 aminotransferase class V-fold PLP-dependent enzyme [Actinocrinis puniceicyclus]